MGIGGEVAPQSRHGDENGIGGGIGQGGSGVPPRGIMKLGGLGSFSGLGKLQQHPRVVVFSCLS
jgi:hypothetical protein